MARLQPKDSMVLDKDAKNIMSSDVDLPNGELLSRSLQEAVYQPRLQLERQHTALLDMGQSASKMVLFQSSNQRFYKMEITILMYALTYLKECFPQSCLNFSTNTFSLRDSCSSQIW